MHGKLTALGVARLKTPGMYGDGQGLWLQVTGKGAKSWIFRFTLSGRSREMGLGSAHTFGLAEARERARECRKLTAEGVDPIESRKARRQEAALEASRAVTFKQCTEAYINANKAGWRHPRHIRQWPSSMQNHVYPVIGDLPVRIVDTGLVMRVLEPLWSNRIETAVRMRNRIELVLDWATAHGYREGENPARWRGHLKNLLPNQSRIRKVKHHEALPYQQVPSLVSQLLKKDTVEIRALAFTILTAVRVGEALGARWSEIDLEGAVWTVPDQRMKAGIEHRVPLSELAMKILRLMQGADHDLVFPGTLRKRRLDNARIRYVLHGLIGSGPTVHGFRSSFRDWASECTSFPRDVAEMALSHAVGDKTERAYRRTDLFEKRRELMDAWAGYVASSAELSRQGSDE